MKRLFLIIGLLLLVSTSINAYASGNLLYALNNDTSTISIIDATTNGVITSINIGYLANWIVANPAKTALYVSDYTGDKINIINPATNAVTGTISINGPAGMAITSDGATMYVSMYDDDKVAIVDLRTKTVTGYITVGDMPNAIAIMPNDSKVYVANYRGIVQAL